MANNYKLTLAVTIKGKQREEAIEKTEMIEAPNDNNARLIAAKICEYMKNKDPRVISAVVKKITRWPSSS